MKAGIAVSFCLPCSSYKQYSADRPWSQGITVHMLVTCLCLHSTASVLRQCHLKETEISIVVLKNPNQNHPLVICLMMLRIMNLWHL
jgi:hypothetical protein